MGRARCQDEEDRQRTQSPPVSKPDPSAPSGARYWSSQRLPSLARPTGPAKSPTQPKGRVALSRPARRRAPKRRRPRSPAISISGVEDHRRGNAGACCILATANLIKPRIKRRSRSQPHQLTPQILLHRLALERSPRRQHIPHFLRHPSNGDLHRHDSIMTALPANCITTGLLGMDLVKAIGTPAHRSSLNGDTAGMYVARRYGGEMTRGGRGPAEVVAAPARDGAVLSHAT